MIETTINIGGHKMVIERFDMDDYAVYYVDYDRSTRGTLAEVMSDICDTFGDCINDFRF